MGDRMTAVEIGIRIKAIRKRRDIRQDALARQAGIDRSYMGRIERGEVNVSVTYLYDIAEALNIPITELLDW